MGRGCSHPPARHATTHRLRFKEGLVRPGLGSFRIVEVCFIDRFRRWNKELVLCLGRTLILHLVSIHNEEAGRSDRCFHSGPTLSNSHLISADACIKGGANRMSRAATYRYLITLRLSTSTSRPLAMSQEALAFLFVTPMSMSIPFILFLPACDHAWS